MVETLLNSRVGVVYRLVVRRAGRDVVRDALVFHDYKRAVSHVATLVRRHASSQTPDAVLLQRGTLNGGSVRRLGLDALHWTELECWGPEVVQRIITQDRMWNPPPLLREPDPSVETDVLRPSTGSILCPSPRAMPLAAPVEPTAAPAAKPAGAPTAAPATEPATAPTAAPVMKLAAAPDAKLAPKPTPAHPTPMLVAPTPVVPGSTPIASTSAPTAPASTPVKLRPSNGSAVASPKAAATKSAAAKPAPANATMTAELAELEQLSKRWYKSRGWYLIVATVIIAATWLAVLFFMTGGRPDVILRNYFAPHKTEAPPADIGFDGSLLHSNGNGSGNGKHE